VKREIERRRKLPSFQLTLDDLELLVKEMSRLIGAEDVRRTIRVRLPNEDIRFDSVLEMRLERTLPATIRAFSVLVSKGDERAILIGRGTVDPAELSVYGDNLEWVAGTSEAIYQAINSHRVWYSAFRGGPLLLALLVALTIAFLPRLFFTESPAASDPWFRWGSGALVVVFSLLIGTRTRLLPPATLVTRAEDSMIRRYIPEITLAVAIFALMLTIIGWFVKG